MISPPTGRPQGSASGSRFLIYLGFLLPRRTLLTPPGEWPQRYMGVCMAGHFGLHSEELTLWFALRGIAPLWLLLRSPLRPLVAFPLCLGLFLEGMPSLLPPSHHPLAWGPYPSRLPQTARRQAFSPARGIPAGSPRHLSPTASGAWRTRRAPSASGRARHSPLEQSCVSARAASSRPARGFPSEAPLPGWRRWPLLRGVAMIRDIPREQSMTRCHLCPPPQQA